MKQVLSPKNLKLLSTQLTKQQKKKALSTTKGTGNLLTKQFFSAKHFPRENYGFTKEHQLAAIGNTFTHEKIDLGGKSLKDARRDVGHVVSFDSIRDMVVQAGNGDRRSLARLVRGLTTTSAAEASQPGVDPEHAKRLLAANHEARRTYLSFRHALNPSPGGVQPSSPHPDLLKLARKSLKATANHYLNTSRTTESSVNRSTSSRLHPIDRLQDDGTRDFDGPSKKAMLLGLPVWSRQHPATQDWHITTQNAGGWGMTEKEFGDRGYTNRIDRKATKKVSKRVKDRLQLTAPPGDGD